MTLRGRLRQWNEVPRRDLLDGDVQIGAQPDEGSREGVSVGHGDVVCEVNVLGSDFLVCWLECSLALPTLSGRSQHVRMPEEPARQHGVAQCSLAYDGQASQHAPP